MANWSPGAGHAPGLRHVPARGFRRGRQGPAPWAPPGELAARATATRETGGAGVSASAFSGSTANVAAGPSAASALRRFPEFATICCRPSLGRLIGTPAIVFGPRLDILAWNPSAAQLLCDFAAVPESERHYVRVVFTDPVMRDIHPEWEDVARTCVEVLRMEAGTNPTDPALTALVGELAVVDQRFRVRWAEHRVAHQDFGSKHVARSLVGGLALDWDTFRYAGAPEQQLVLWSAEPGTSDAERLAGPAHGTAQGPRPS